MTTKDLDNKRTALLKLCDSFRSDLIGIFVNYILEKHKDYKMIENTIERVEYFNKKNNTYLTVGLPNNFLPATLTIYIHNTGIKNRLFTWYYAKEDLDKFYETKLKDLL